MTIPIERMSRHDKLRALEALWTDLTQEEAKIDSPTWHVEALRETENLVRTGKAQFSDWQEAKLRIRRKAAKRA